MDAMTCIETRRTAAAVGPEPTPDQLAAILHAATRAPDHKLLRPWRFIVVRGEERARVGEALQAAARAADPAVAAEVLAKLAHKATRAPLFVVVIASPSPGGKAPVWEQHASAAAAATNMCLAAHALGLASAWKSTHLGGEPAVRALFGMEPHEECFGWIELGTPAPGKLKDRPPVELGAVATELRGGRRVPFAP